MWSVFLCNYLSQPKQVIAIFPHQLQKFSHLYEVLAEKYGVSADRVVLNLKDKIIHPTLCPGDLQVTIVDVIGE